MNYLEIIFKNVKINYLDQIIGGYIEFDPSDIVSSHFFDKKDMEYSDIENFETYFRDSGTCNIYLKKIHAGMELKDVLILVACDGENGDITLNFSEEQFHHMKKSDLKSKFCGLIQNMVELCKCCEINDLILGYEPAEDEDMKVMEIKQGQITNFNEDIHQSKVVQVFHQIGNEKLSPDIL